MNKTFFLLLALLACGCRSEPTLSLIEALPTASSGPLLAPRGPLGSNPSTPFVGPGWASVANTPERTTLAGTAELRFIKTQNVPITITLEGRGNPSVSPSRGTEGGVPSVMIKLNDHDCGTFPLGNTWQELTIPAQAAIEGLNRLTLTSPNPSQWRKLQVLPLNASPHAGEALANANALCLYAGTTREFPVVLEPGAHLLMDDLIPWGRPGFSFSFSSTGVKLRVRVQSGEARVDQTSTFTGRDLALPTLTGPACLSLTVLSDQPLPDGAWGLCLKSPRLTHAHQTQIDPPKNSKKEEKNSPTPTIVLCVLDSVRADQSGPHLDQLAREGTRYLDCTTAASWTRPSLAAMFTGVSPERNGVQDFYDSLPPSQGTLAELLTAGGYRTVGLVSNTLVGDVFGMERGFTSFHQLAWADGARLIAAAAPELFSNKKPLFLYLHLMDAHLPYRAPDRFVPPRLRGKILNNPDAYKLFEDAQAHRPDVEARLADAKALYAGAVAGADAQFGKLVELLKKSGRYQNSLILVTGDHGDEFFEHGCLGHLRTVYQEIVHVPLICKYPSANVGNVSTPVTTLDLAPTILKAAGLPQPTWMKARPLDEDDGKGPLTFSIHTGLNTELFGGGVALRQSFQNGVRLGNWVLLRSFSTHINEVSPEPIELYNLSNDPGEHHNLAYARPEIRVALEALLTESRSERRKPVHITPEKARLLRSLGYVHD